jgi:hypothetical protein
MKIDLQKHWGNSELYYVAELCAKIIHSMQVDGSVYLWTNEGKNPANNGFYELLDQLCEYWKWDKSLITISTANEKSSHDEYKVVYSDYNIVAANFDTSRSVYEWNKEKLYGMFIGRADAARVRAIHTHHNFEYKQHGITSFNDNLFLTMDKLELVKYFFHSNQTYNEMISIKPYSDIGPVISPPITPANDTQDWSKVYEKIAIEIVCETSTLPNCTDFSEKTFRPLYYKRPFLLIGSPGQLKYLNDIGYKTFDGIITEDYDHLSGMQRVDRVFEILHQLIESGSIYTLLDQCQSILDHNQKTVVNECRRQQIAQLIKNRQTGISNE